MTLNQEEQEQLKQGFLYAVRLLAVTKRSRQELAKRLDEKGYPPLVIGEVTRRLEEKGILSDRKLIEGMVDRAIHEKRHGRRRIQFDLERKKVDQTLIEPALLNYSPEDERANAHSLASERWEKLSRVEPNKRKKRLYDYLINRGFSFELCRGLVTELANRVNQPDENI